MDWIWTKFFAHFFTFLSNVEANRNCFPYVLENDVSKYVHVKTNQHLHIRWIFGWDLKSDLQKKNTSLLIYKGLIDQEIS